VKKFGYIFISFGLILLGFFLLADVLGSGKDSGVGAAQLLGIVSGVALILLGFGFLMVDWSELDVIRQVRAKLRGFCDLPLSAWVLITFVLEYAAFFLLPVFFVEQRIRYFNKYIPDAYITRIGFDISATISSIQNWLLLGQSPYDGFIIYSPIALILLAPLMLLGYPAYYHFIAAMTFLSFCGIFIVSSSILQTKNKSLLVFFFIVGLFSYGFQFELERGQFNVIAFFLTLFAIYLYHYHHKFRYYAYVFFSLAIQLKIYPAIFILLLVKDWKDWKRNLKRFIGLGLSNFSLLFVLGYEFFLAFVSGITSYQISYQTNRYEDLSIRGFVHKLTTDGFGQISFDVLRQLSHYAGLIEVIIWMILGIFLASMLVFAYVRRLEGLNLYMLVVCIIIALIAPSASVDYKLPILAAPLAMVFVCLPTMQSALKKIAATLLVVIASSAYWSTLYPNTVKTGMLSTNFPSLFVIMISIASLYFLTGGKLENPLPDNAKMKST